MINAAKYILLLFFITLFFACRREKVTLILRNVHCIDVVNGEIAFDRDVYIAGNRIYSINPSQEAVIDLPSARIIDGSGQYLIPGLWDMHVHALNDFEYQFAFPLYIANGITGIRDMWGNLTLADSLRNLQTLHNLPLPRFYTGGGILGGNPARNGTSIATEEEGVQYVDTLVKYGADFIKTYEYLKPDIYFAIVERAKNNGLPVFGHPPELLGIREAINAGQKSFEHLCMVPFWCTPYTDFLIRDMKDEWYGPGLPLTADAFRDTIYQGFLEDSSMAIAKAMVDTEAFFCPTIMVYQNIANPLTAEMNNRPVTQYFNPFRKWYWQHDLDWDKENFLKDSINYEWRRVLERRKLILSRFIDAGVKIVAGTDAPVSVHGFDLHRELKNYVSAGMTPLDALRTATVNPARLLEIEDEVGQIREGFLADLVLLQKNPLEDIRNTESIISVIVDGRYVSKEEIELSLDQLARLHLRSCLDTIAVAIKNNGITAAMKLIDTLAYMPEEFYLGGGQLTLLAYQQMDLDQNTEALQLLRKEVELHPKDAQFAWMSLVGLYEDLEMPDSALACAEYALKSHNSSFTYMMSKIKRLKDPGFALPRYKQLSHHALRKFEGDYTGPNECVLKAMDKGLFMIVDNDTLILNAVNDTVFHIQGSEPDRIIFIRNQGNRFKLIRGRTQLEYVR